MVGDWRLMQVDSVLSLQVSKRMSLELQGRFDWSATEQQQGGFELKVMGYLCFKFKVGGRDRKRLHAVRCGTRISRQGFLRWNWRLSACGRNGGC